MADYPVNERGTVVPAALALILIFAVTTSSLALIIMNHARFSIQAKAVNEIVGAKSKEALTVKASTVSGSTTINATNVGSTPSLIVAVYAVNPSDKSLTYYKLDPPIGVGTLRQKTFQVATPGVTDAWTKGVLTSLGNIFWET